MVDCLSCVSSGSTVSKPERDVLPWPQNCRRSKCLCEAFKNSAQFGVSLNVTKAFFHPPAKSLLLLLAIVEIENEYGNIENSYGQKGKYYVKWAAKMAVGLGAGVPWIMCNQLLEFRVFNICYGTLPIQGKLPSTPGSSLTWFGFSEEGQLSSFDSKGVLRVFTNQYGGSWLPLFSASKLKKPEENYWVAGLNANKLFCICFGALGPCSHILIEWEN